MKILAFTKSLASRVLAIKTAAVCNRNAVISNVLSMSRINLQLKLKTMSNVFEVLT